MSKSIQLKDFDGNVYPKIKNDYMVIRLSENQVIKDTNITKVLFDVILCSYGDSLTFENNSIKIGKGVSRIRVDLTIWGEAVTGYLAWHIFKNNIESTYNLSPDVRSSGVDAWRTGNAFIYLDVKEGDLINARVRYSVAESNGYNRIAGSYNNSCLLGVQVIS